MKLKVKVCGLREAEDVRNIAEADIQFAGFIFHKDSPRYVGDDFDTAIIKLLPRKIRKYGVFVNGDAFKIMSIAVKYDLDGVQLHGKEKPATCRMIKLQGFKVIKAFSIDEKFDFSILETYSDYCDFFLFDTKSDVLGGSGKKFDWQLLNEYKLSKPFFFSGGINENDVEAIKALKHTSFAGIDINSGFETKPAKKDIPKIKQFVDQLNSNAVTA